MISRSGRCDLWSRFVAEYWEKKAALLIDEQLNVLPRIEADELFRAVVACSNDFCREGRQKVRLYVQGSEVDVLGGEHQEILPKYEDTSFLGYNHRMIERYGFNDYALIVADWHQFDRALWDRILVSLEGLATKVGISRSRMDTQVFLGTYKFTPFGVHADPTSAFHFPVIGTKMMRFWQNSFAVKTPAIQRTPNYEAFLQDSIAIKASPGQAIYWPSEYWHVAESDGSFSVAWGFGYWMGDSLRKLAIAKAAAIFDEIESPSPVMLPSGLVHAAENLRLIDDATGDLLRAVSSQRYRQCIVETWLEYYSAYGFLRVPPLLDRFQIDRLTSVRKKPTLQILASKVTSSSICVAAAGRSCILPFNTTIRMAIDRLNQGEPVTVTELLGEDSDRSAITTLIDFCLRSGALIADQAYLARTDSAATTAEVRGDESQRTREADSAE